ncbi:THAP domain-containing protein 6 isoform X3 [Dicentrarchus labrax]|uniref:THAP domain-containing protein 6 isoform X3 n=1 Tax=Dicentrarchus labrax TaxID=13489 RepID=UPI0021F596E3|nr:THAP domain-containing protein 6 isoform X3 [Dicentrarchus labrax]
MKRCRTSVPRMDALMSGAYRPDLVGSLSTGKMFPKDNSLKRQWELAVKREGFVAAERSLLCSEHFKPDDFDRTGQIVRLRHGVKPSVFNFPSHLQKQVPSRTTKASRTAEESLPVDLPQHFPEAEPYSNVAKLSEALARVESLEREKRNSMIRERRAKKNVHALLKDLRGKNLINEELKDRLECYSDLRVDLLWRISEGREFQRVGAATLKALSPKVP